MAKTRLQKVVFDTELGQVVVEGGHADMFEFLNSLVVLFELGRERGHLEPALICLAEIEGDYS
jgi:hypothetical protein